MSVHARRRAVAVSLAAIVSAAALALSDCGGGLSGAPASFKRAVTATTGQRGGSVEVPVPGTRPADSRP